MTTEDRPSVTILSPDGVEQIVELPVLWDDIQRGEVRSNWRVACRHIALDSESSMKKIGEIDFFHLARSALLPAFYEHPKHSGIEGISIKHIVFPLGSSLGQFVALAETTGKAAIRSTVSQFGKLQRIMFVRAGGEIEMSQASIAGVDLACLCEVCKSLLPGSARSLLLVRKLFPSFLDRLSPRRRIPYQIVHSGERYRAPASSGRCPYCGYSNAFLVYDLQRRVEPH